MELAPSADPLPPDGPVRPELVLQNSKLAGSRRPLAGPVTVLGRAPGCDIRLNLEGVQPIHCLILHAQGGLLIRDMGSVLGTLVNGEAVSMSTLAEGDILTVGPFHFKVAFPPGWEEANLSPEALQAEREALRVQAAAVAAQQVAVTDRELQLEQKHHALKRQEGQLVEHLDGRKKEVNELLAQFKEERAAFRHERTEAVEREKEAWAEIKTVRADLDQARLRLSRDRDRVAQLRKIQKERFKSRWDRRSAEILQREEQLLGQEARVREEQEHLRLERERFHEVRLRENGELELARRQIQDGWEELRLAQQGWEEGRALADMEVRQQQRELADRARALERAEKALAREKASWEKLHEHLQKDLLGLEHRIRSQRGKLTALEQQLAATQASLEPARSLPAAAFSPAPGGGLSTPPAGGEAVPPETAAQMRRLLGDLADQRQHLLEQWGVLLETEEGWQRERQQLLGQLEDAARHLADRQQEALGRDQQLCERQARLDAQAEQVGRLRASLEGWHARLKVKWSAWTAERDRLYTEVRAREEAAAKLASQAQAQRKRCLRRIRRDLHILLEAQQKCEEVRQQLIVTLQESEERTANLTEQQQEASRKTLSLERYQQELLASAPSSPAAEKRIERLEREYQALTARAERQLRRDRQELNRLLERLEDQGKELARQEKSLARQHRELMQDQTAAENNRLRHEHELLQQKRDLEKLRATHEKDQTLIRTLSEEVERLAGLLLDLDGPVILPTPQDMEASPDAQGPSPERGAA